MAEQFNDHDLLIELKTEFRGMRQDIKDIKDNTKDQISALILEQAAQGKRISALENWRWYLLGAFAAGLLVIQLAGKFTWN